MHNLRVAFGGPAVFCPACGKEIQSGNFCIFCGRGLPSTDDASIFKITLGACFGIVAAYIIYSLYAGTSGLKIWIAGMILIIVAALGGVFWRLVLIGVVADFLYLGWRVVRSLGSR
jgi:hypothetical protein